MSFSLEHSTPPMSLEKIGLVSFVLLTERGKKCKHLGGGNNVTTYVMHSYLGSLVHCTMTAAERQPFNWITVIRLVLALRDRR